MSAALAYPNPAADAPKTWYSPEEYLAFDNAAEGRFEYADGRITPVGAPGIVNVLDPTFRAGASPAHYEISRMLTGLLFSRLSAGCRAYASDARVHIPVTRAYTYPDVVIVCGKPEYTDPEAAIPSLLNPKIIVEILSDSTADYDRVGKFMRYRSIESLCEYVLIDPRMVAVELFARQPDGNWSYSPANELSAELLLPSVSCRVGLAELYAGILPA